MQTSGSLTLVTGGEIFEIFEVPVNASDNATVDFYLRIKPNAPAFDITLATSYQVLKVALPYFLDSIQLWQ